MVRHWIVRMCLYPLRSKTTEKHCLPHPRHERQCSGNVFAILYLAQSEWQLVGNSPKRGIGHLYSQKRKLHMPCPILKMNVNRGLTISGLAWWVI